MKILILSKKFPYPLRDGESVAIYNQCKSFAELNVEVSLLSMNTTKHYSHTEKYRDELSFFKNVHTVYLDNELHIMDALSNLFSGKSYHIQRFVNQHFSTKLIDILTHETFDVIQLESVYMAPYLHIIRKYSNAVVVMRAHNIEFEIWERLVKKSKYLWIKLYLALQARRLKKIEIELLNKYDLLIPVSSVDELKFKKLGVEIEMITIPIGIDVSEYPKLVPTKRKSERFVIAFLGSLDWMPNVRGLDWFLKRVWPLLIEKHKEIKLEIAGRNCPESIKNLRMKNVVVHGEIVEIQEFIENCNVMIVPVFSGSGMRVKILEGMASAKVVVTTSLGLEGIGARDGAEVLVANTAQEFCDVISECINNREKMINISNNARLFAKKNFDRRILTGQMIRVYQRKIEFLSMKDNHCVLKSLQ